MTSTETRGACAPAQIPKRHTPDPSAIDPDAMAVDLGSCLATSAVASRFGVTEATIARWRAVGCRGADGRNHVLPSIRVGGRVVTHRADLAIFLAALNQS